MKPTKTGPGGPNGTDGTPSTDDEHLNASKRVSKRYGGVDYVRSNRFGLPDGSDPRMVDRANAANRPFKFKTLSREKLALIHVAKAQTRLSDYDYSELLFIVERVNSAKELTEDRFARLMKAFERIGFVSRQATKGYGPRDGFASEAQVLTIRNLWRDWTEADDDKKLDRWLRNHFRVSSLRFATVSTAQMAIEGLKAMLARKDANATKGAPTRPSTEE